MRIAALLVILLSTQAFAADEYVRGHTRSDGTYVAPHHQTTPDHNPYNNYSSQGNVNPYTGQAGTRDPYQVQQQYSNSYGGGSNNSNLYGNSSEHRRSW